MAVAENASSSSECVRRPRRPLARAQAPVYLVIAFIGILWLVPTIGLFFTSLLARR